MQERVYEMLRVLITCLLGLAFRSSTETGALREEVATSPAFFQQRRPPTAGKLPQVLEKWRNNKDSSCGHIYHPKQTIVQ